MSKCVICACKSDDLKSYTVEYGYYEGRAYSSKSHNSTYTSNILLNTAPHVNCVELCDHIAACGYMAHKAV